MNKILSKMVEMLINKKTNEASKLLNMYLVNKTASIVEGMNSSPFDKQATVQVEKTTKGDKCRLEISFADKDVASKVWMEMIDAVDETFEQFNAVDTGFDQDTTNISVVWIFIAEPSQHERIRQVVEQKMYELVETTNDEFSSTDADEYDIDSDYDEERGASKAEDDWLKGRGY